MMRMLHAIVIPVAATLAGAAGSASFAAQSIDIAGEPSKGSRDAKVALVVFSEYQCRYSGAYAREMLPRLEADYLKTGRVRYVLRDLPLPRHKLAMKAAEAAHCAGAQGKFWEMHDALFRDQSALAPDQLTRHAVGLGLKAVPFQLCLNTRQFAPGIEKDVADARQAGVAGTPTFLVGRVEPGGRRVEVLARLEGAGAYADLKAALDAALQAVR